MRNSIEGQRINHILRVTLAAAALGVTLYGASVRPAAGDESEKGDKGGIKILTIPTPFPTPDTSPTPVIIDNGNINGLPEKIKSLILSDVANREGTNASKAEVAHYELLKFADSGLDEKCKLPGFMSLQTKTDGGRLVVRIPGKTTYEYFFSNPQFGDPNIKICDAAGAVIPSLAETMERVREQEARITGRDKSVIRIKAVGITKNSSSSCKNEFAGALFAAYIIDETDPKHPVLTRGDLYFASQENGTFNPNNVFYCQRTS
ncbi:MAG: hypothetical protein Q7K55_06975 [Candidatus Levybacteria bacterium]|nr:hypothetical protein [Candidatus Levybacteria bacterium]